MPNNLYRPSSPVLLRVKEVLPISPSLRRITLAGPGMEHFPHHCPAAHIKVFLPRPHQEVPTLPELGPNGPIWPPAEVKPIVRTFSVRAFRPNQKELDIEFTCHGTIGPASRFALSAQVGDAIGISYPGGPDPMIVPADVYHMAADTSALPALASILEHLPQTAVGHCLIRVEHPDDRRDLKRPPGMQLHWIVSEPEALEELKDTYCKFMAPQAKTFYWIAGEHKMVLAFRHQAVRTWKIPKDMVYAIPYWRFRQSEERYHELRHEVMNDLDAKEAHHP